MNGPPAAGAAVQWPDIWSYAYRNYLSRYYVESGMSMAEWMEWTRAQKTKVLRKTYTGHDFARVPRTNVERARHPGYDWSGRMNQFQFGQRFNNLVMSATTTAAFVAEGVEHRVDRPERYTYEEIDRWARNARRMRYGD